MTGPGLLCFDGSDGASRAIAVAGDILRPCRAVVLTVWEPVAIWEAFDPGAIVSAGLSRFGGEALGLDDIAREIAHKTNDRGVELARAAGFDAAGQVVGGKIWRAICDAADELDAAAIVLGAQGLSRVQSVLLGSVSAAVVAHAGRPTILVPRPHA